MVDFFGIGSFRIECHCPFGLILQTLENCFKINIDDKWNLELVLPTMEPHEGICFKHVYSNCFVVFAIFEVLVPGHFAVESLEADQAEVVFMLVLAVTASE